MSEENPMIALYGITKARQKAIVDVLASCIRHNENLGDATRRLIKATKGWPTNELVFAFDSFGNYKGVIAARDRPIVAASLVCSLNRMAIKAAGGIHG